MTAYRVKDKNIHTLRIASVRELKQEKVVICDVGGESITQM